MVLIYLEDSFDYQEMFYEFFSHSHQIHLAASASEAINLVRSLPKIDLIISDYYLGEGSTSSFLFDYLADRHLEIPAILFSNSDFFEMKKNIKYKFIKKMMEKNLSAVNAYLEEYCAR